MWRGLFATFGVPKKVCSDNGAAFISEEIATFYRMNNIIAVTSAPYHPATNGQAERMVQELKQAVSKKGREDLSCVLSRFLFKQHTTVHATTGKTPAWMMYGRELPSALDRLKSSLFKQLPEENSDIHKFTRGQPVWIRQFPNERKWMPGSIARRAGPRSWMVDTERGQVRRHLNHIRHRAPNSSCWETQPPPPVWDMCLHDRQGTHSGANGPEQTTKQHSTDDDVRPLPTVGSALSTATRVSFRARRPPNRYGAHV
ncbi:uncharacterized protein ISCGN_003973 [Ixodes scapularis]